MKTAYRKYLIPGLTILALLPLAGWLAAASRTGESDSADQACVRCHVEVFNQGLASSNMHPPFWERQCSVCHLAEGEEWAPQEQAETTVLTGTVVDQQNLWRKSQSYTANTVPDSRHLASLNDLDQSKKYRFRLIVANERGSSAQSIWLGLKPNELAESRRQEIAALKTSNVLPFRNLTLFRNGDTVYVDWQTEEPLSGSVEVQELSGLGLDGLQPESAAADQEAAGFSHPVLRDPEDLAIDICYQCHSESDLGTSHPVRLYGGRDVQIPDDLPTVDGMLTCVTCHDPHGAPGEMLVREKIKTKLCVACHIKFKGSSPSTMF